MNRCYFISSDAKQLYHNICDYAYGGRRECFPSQEKLKAELCWGNSRFDKSLKELRDFKLIITHRVQGKPLIYQINELHKVPVIIHSEIVHTLSSKCNDFFDKLSEYKKSELCQRANKKPMELKEEIKNWFLGTKKKVGKNEKINLPPVIRESLEVTFESQNKKRRKKKVTFYDDVAEWTIKTFAKYFEYLYQFKFKKPYLPRKGDLKQLKRIMEVKDKETIKHYMEIFIDLDFFDTKTLRIFCSNYSQTVLDQYTSTGKLPNWKKENNLNEPKHLKEWANEIDNIFGGGC